MSNNGNDKDELPEHGMTWEEFWPKREEHEETEEENAITAFLVWLFGGYKKG